MLRFSTGFTNDREVNKFLEQYINNALKYKLLNEYLNPSLCEWESEEIYIPMEIDALFPENFPDDYELKFYVLKSLYSLLMSKQKWVPTLLMEYILYKLINIAIANFYEVECRLAEDDVYDYEKEEYIKDYMTEEEKQLATYVISKMEHFNNRFKEYIEKQQDVEIGYPFSKKMADKICKAYEKFYAEEIYYDDIEDAESYEEAVAKAKKKYKKEIQREARDKMNSLWHFSDYWFEFCFWDDDFIFLDEMSVGEIRNSGWNKYAQMVPDNADEDAYFLPDDWKHSTEFHFLNRPN